MKFKESDHNSSASMLTDFLSFLRWGGGEIVELVPAGMRALFTGVPRGIVLKLDPEIANMRRSGLEISLPLNGPWASIQLGGLSDVASRPAKRPVDLVLPTSVCLERRIEVAPKARRHARQIAELDLARSTPIDRATIICRHLIEKIDGGKIIVRQFILKKDEVEALDDTMRSAGLELRTVRVEPVQGWALEPFLDKSGEFAMPWRWWRRLNWVFLTVSLASATYLIVTPHMSRLDEIKRLKQVSTELLERADILRSELERRTEIRSAEINFAEALRRYPRVVDVLSALSDALPDTVWVQSLELDQRTVVFNGISRASATELVSDLSSSEYFTETQLIGTVAFDTALKVERFKISTQIGFE